MTSFIVSLSLGSEKKVKVTVETVTMKVTPESNAIKETTTTSVKKTKADKTIFVKKTESDKEQKASVAKKEEQKKGTEASLSKTKTTVKTSILTKVTAKTPAATNATKTGKVVKTVGQVFLKQPGRRPEQATKGKTEVKKIDTKGKVTTKQETSLKKVQLKDQPLLNVTQTAVKKTNGTSKTLTQLVKDAKTSVNVTTSEKTVIKTTKVVKTTGTQATDDTIKVTVKTGSVKVKPTVSTATTATEKDKKLVQANATVVLKEGPVVKKKVESQLNVTTIETKVQLKQTNKTISKAASSVVSVVVQNITSTGFILTWEASHGLFRNFTVSRRELPAGVEDREEEVAVEEAEKAKLEKQEVTVTGNITEVLKQSGNKTTISAKVHVSSGAKAEGKSVRKFTQVLPGTARTFQFRNLRPQTRYALSLFGTAPGFRSKIYRLTATTGISPSALSPRPRPPYYRTADRPSHLLECSVHSRS